MATPEEYLPPRVGDAAPSRSRSTGCARRARPSGEAAISRSSRPTTSRRERAISYRDLAERHGLTETTVTNHLAAVRRQFREIVLETLREVTATERGVPGGGARASLGVDA